MAGKMLDQCLVEINQKFGQITAKPQKFLRVEDDLIANLRLLIKDVYDTNKHNEPLPSVSRTKPGSNANSLSLPELMIDGFDEEQIWQELELQNQPLYEDSVKAIARLASKTDLLTFVRKANNSTTSLPCLTSETTEDVEEEEDNDSLSDIYLGSDLEASDESGSEDGLAFGEAKADLEGDEDGFFTPDEGIEGDENFDVEETEQDVFNLEPKERLNSSKPNRPSVVDDEFFKLGDLEQFLNKEDTREEKRRDGDENSEEEDANVDHFEGFSSGEEENDEGTDAMYADFFDVPAHKKVQKRKEPTIPENLINGAESSSKKVKFSLEADPDLDSQAQSSEAKSSFDERQARLANQISRFENEALSNKPWQLTGEIAADTRPENALLEEDLQFDHTTRAAPVITEETTKTLEDIIRQRVKDAAWDDVERKVKPVNTPMEYKKQLVLDSDKPKQGLAELYEEEYQKLQAKQAGNAPDSEATTKEHEEIKKLTREVFAQLDALANFHYTPKMPSAEVRIVSNLPSLSREEAVPLSVSDAQVLAPEEVTTRPRGDVKSKSERTTTDKKHERRLKKTFQRSKSAAAAQKPNSDQNQALKQLEHAQKTGKVTKMTEVQTGSRKPLKSSTAFFAQLQDQVTQAVKGGGANSSHTPSKTKKQDQKSLTSTRLKL
nr:EOG090X09DZ [Lepidurus arcticus]